MKLPSMEEQGQGSKSRCSACLRPPDPTLPGTGPNLNFPHDSSKNQKEEKPEELDFGQRRILLVDDLELNREVAEFILTENGFLVEMAPDGTDAVEMVRKSPEGYYDAILMDVQTPIMNGYEATRNIRNLDRKDVAHLPIIAMPANALEEDRAAALKAGMNAHIAKPIDLGKFLEVMKGFFPEAVVREKEDA